MQKDVLEELWLLMISYPCSLALEFPRLLGFAAREARWWWAAGAEGRKSPWGRSNIVEDQP